jgi:hypothetical protein
MPSSGMLLRAALIRTDGSEKRITTQCKNSEDGILHIPSRENLKSYIKVKVSNPILCVLILLLRVCCPVLDLAKG